METVWIDRKDGEREGRIAADCLNGYLLEEPMLLSDSKYNDAGILAHNFYVIQFPQLL